MGMNFNLTEEIWLRVKKTAKNNIDSSIRLEEKDNMFVYQSSKRWITRKKPDSSFRPAKTNREAYEACWFDVKECDIWWVSEQTVFKMKKKREECHCNTQQSEEMKEKERRRRQRTDWARWNFTRISALCLSLSLVLIDRLTRRIRRTMKVAPTIDRRFQVSVPRKGPPVSSRDHG